MKGGSFLFPFFCIAFTAFTKIKGLTIGLCNTLNLIFLLDGIAVKVTNHKNSTVSKDTTGIVKG